jgi:glycosyltransferase involved in cell wall biosynthesis
VKISIITAVRNGAGTVRRTLESVAGQDYADIEHIVVDGASTDGTVDLIRAHGPRVSQLISEPDTGVYQAFNKGLHAATGEVIGFLNAADSYCSPTAISAVAAAVAPESVDAVFGDVLIVDPRDESQVLRYYSSRDFRPSRLAWGFMPAHPTLFLKRRVYDACGGYDPAYRIAGDFEFCLRAFIKHHVRYRYIADALVRMPSGGLSNRGWRSKWTITREMRRACAVNDVPTNLLKLSSRFPLKMAEVLRRAS